MSAPSTFVIVGASLAGAKAAETLRSEGFDGRVVLLGTEPERPYERPALSKDHLQGKAARGVLHVHEEGFYAAHDIELRTSSTVTAIDVGAREVIVDGREQVGFDRLLLATGAEPRRLDVPGSDLDGILYLRDLNDAEAIRQRMAPGATAVVIGAGWIGAEVAASLRQAGLEVTMVEQAQVPLERVLGPEVGAVYARLHREHGVDLRTGTGLAAFEGAGTVEHVVTTGPAPRVRLRRGGHRRGAAHEGGRGRGPGRRPRRPRRRPPADQRAGDLRRRRRSQRSSPSLRGAPSRRALGQRPAPGPGSGAQHARSG